MIDYLHMDSHCSQPPPVPLRNATLRNSSNTFFARLSRDIKSCYTRLGFDIESYVSAKHFDLVGQHLIPLLVR